VPCESLQSEQARTRLRAGLDAAFAEAPQMFVQLSIFFPVYFDGLELEITRATH
jgi:hypothetical protein